MSKEIPIFFSTDDNYVPYLDVALSSLIKNASAEYSYRIIVLNTGLGDENIAKIKKNERPGFAIDFIDISDRVESISSHFKNLYHFSIVTYYRLFIASLFPEYDKILYLDCDIVVLGDVSRLYNTPLGDNILGAVTDQYVPATPEFRRYAEVAVGVDPDTYFNAGVLVISLEQFRKNDIEKKFIRLITQYDFDLLDPDQAYLNYLCRDKTKILPAEWNRVPSRAADGGVSIVHFALYKKPWHQGDVEYGEYFWQYAKKSPFYGDILKAKASFGDAETAKSEAAARDILEHAKSIVESNNTFAKQLGRR